MNSFELSRIQVGLCYEKPANEFFAKYIDIFAVIHCAAAKAEGNFLNEFLADALGSEIVEATLRYVTDRINEEAKLLGFSTTPAYGPGHCTWQVNEQKSLFSLLPENPCRITLNASSLMSPIKSVSGVIGLGIKIKQKPYACAICRLRNCHKRKVPRLL